MAALATVNNQAPRELTLKSMMREAGEIHDLVQAKNFDLEQAQAKAQALYQAGVRLIPGEVSYKPIVNESVIPIAIELSKILAEPSIMHASPLVSALSKAYLLFVELTWIQSWRGKCTNNEVYAVPSNLKNTLTMVALDAIKPLPAKSIVDTKFHLHSTEEAVKCLQNTESIWGKYAEGATELGAAAFNLKFGDLLTGLKTLFSNVKKDQPATWYLDTYLSRWKTIHARTLKEFVSGLSDEEVEKYEKEGGKYTVCLLLIYMEIFENFETEPELRKLVFERVKNLLTLERGALGEEYRTHPGEVLRAIAGKPDRYGSTRLLAVQTLKQIASKKDQYEPFSGASKAALLTRAEELKKKADKRYLEEKGYLKRRIEEVEKCKVDLEDKAEELSDEIASLAEESRSGESRSIEEAIGEFKATNTAIEMQKEELIKLAEFEELIAFEAEINS